MAEKHKPEKHKPKKAERKREKAARKSAKRASKAGAARPHALLPESVAGVQVPQVLRQSGSALAEFATSDLGRAVIVAALTAAADTILRHRPAAAEGGEGQEAGGSVKAKDVVQNAALAAAGVVKEAAKTVLPPALMGEAPGREGDARPATDGGTRGGAAKR